MNEINIIIDKEKKSQIANNILRKLPEWFGIEESTAEYIRNVKETDFYAAYDVDIPVGFLSIKYINPFTSEIYVTGILKEYQHKGIGRDLLSKALEALKSQSTKFLMVKTLGESHPDKNYKITREFYKAVGFYPVEEIKEIWGPENPCLIMIMNLK